MKKIAFFTEALTHLVIAEDSRLLTTPTSIEDMPGADTNYYADETYGDCGTVICKLVEDTVTSVTLTMEREDTTTYDVVSVDCVAIVGPRPPHPPHYS